MNPLLQQTIDGMTAKISDPRLRPVVQKVVKAGEQVMYSPQTQKLLIQQMQGGGDPAENVGSGIAKLMAILMNQSHGTIPMQAAVPAATILMCDGLDFLEQAGDVQVTPEFLAACTKEMGSAILQVFGVSPEKIQQYMQGQGGQGAPAGDAAAMPAAPMPPGGSIMARARGGALA